jgi:hypothetical protein
LLELAEGGTGVEEDGDDAEEGGTGVEEEAGGIDGAHTAKAVVRRGDIEQVIAAQAAQVLGKCA